MLNILDCRENQWETDLEEALAQSCACMLVHFDSARFGATLRELRLRFPNAHAELHRERHKVVFTFNPPEIARSPLWIGAGC